MKTQADLQKGPWRPVGGATETHRRGYRDLWRPGEGSVETCSACHGSMWKELQRPAEGTMENDRRDHGYQQRIVGHRNSQKGPWKHVEGAA